MKRFVLSTAAVLALSSSLAADEIGELKAQLKLLQDRLNALESAGQKQTEQTQALTDELINIQSSTSFGTIDTTKDIQNLGPAASKVYYAKNPLSIGGYGELFYSRFDPNVGEGSNKESFGDTYRFIPYIGYKFSDKIILNSEIELEHGNELIVEQLYVDFLLDPAAAVRLGKQLVPMGYVNLYHEPTLFNTVQRPDIEKLLIPSTWHELGASVYGSLGDVDYTLGTYAGLDMYNTATGTPKINHEWIRKARVGNESDKGIDNMALAARLDYNGVPGLSVGASAYGTKTGDAKIAGKGEGSLFMFDLHAVYQHEGFKARALYTETSLNNADAYDPLMPEKARGGYLNFEYNVLPHFVRSSTRLPLFVQYENYNLAASRADGKSFGNTESFIVGLNYFPHEQVVLKGEYLQRHNRNDVDETKHYREGIYSFGLGFIF